MSKDSTCKIITDAIKSAKEENNDEPLFVDVTSQQLANEVKAAEAEFSQVIDKELKRIKFFADQENDRISELRRQNEDEVTCPICLEDIPAIVDMEGGEVMKVDSMSCCGVYSHHQCVANWLMRTRIDPTISDACFHCRRNTDNDIRNKTSFWEDRLLTGSTVIKAKALIYFGMTYENGTGGKKRDLKKALKYYEKAAELRNATAETRIATMYYYGHFNELSIPKSLEKAMDMAQRAVNQGHPRAQLILGRFLSQHNSGIDATTEVHRLYALSSYQGDILGMENLHRFYYRQYLEGEINNGNQQSRREYLLLSLYWAGRLGNKKEKDPEKYMDYNKTFVSHFQIALGIWYKRPYYPLTGYSHIPFLTSMKSEIRKGCHDYELELPELVDFWKYVCVNCGRSTQGDKECVLKTCALCKAFSYCSKECQVKHWKAGHKVDCKGRHWIESYFPNIRTSEPHLPCSTHS